MADTFLAKIAEMGILAAPFGPRTVRFVTHLDISEEMIEKVIELLRKLEF